MGSIPDNIIGILHSHNPSGRIMALGLTQPLTEMSTRNVSWGVKYGRAVGLTTLPHLCVDCLEIWEPQLPGLSGLVHVLPYLLYFGWFKFRPGQQSIPKVCVTLSVTSNATKLGKCVI
jgi:hypothetical protein